MTCFKYVCISLFICLGGKGAWVDLKWVTETLYLWWGQGTRSLQESWGGGSGTGSLLCPLLSWDRSGKAESRCGGLRVHLQLGLWTFRGRYLPKWRQELGSLSSTRGKRCPCGGGKTHSDGCSPSVSPAGMSGSWVEKEASFLPQIMWPRGKRHLAPQESGGRSALLEAGGGLTRTAEPGCADSKISRPWELP